MDFEKAKNKAKNIELIIFDVDGVFTDGKINCTPTGEAFKSFDVQDGTGVTIWNGILNKKTAVITGRKKDIIENRLKELKIEYVLDNQKLKHNAYQEIKSHFKLDDNQIAYIGDDLIDLLPIKQAGLGCTVANARQLVKDHADYVSEKSGGNGAVREIIDLIVEAQGLTPKVMDFYLNK
jgi:3-deoxy-D-manno-octulosonate 8-phosphate phosphatase (KDO 8-P phosphatase)